MTMKVVARYSRLRLLSGAAFFTLTLVVLLGDFGPTHSTGRLYSYPTLKYIAIAGSAVGVMVLIAQIVCTTLISPNAVYLSQRNLNILALWRRESIDRGSIDSIRKWFVPGIIVICLSD